MVSICTTFSSQLLCFPTSLHCQLNPTRSILQPLQSINTFPSVMHGPLWFSQFYTWSFQNDLPYLKRGKKNPSYSSKSIQYHHFHEIFQPKTGGLCILLIIQLQWLQYFILYIIFISTPAVSELLKTVNFPYSQAQSQA